MSFFPQESPPSPRGRPVRKAGLMPPSGPSKVDLAIKSLATPQAGADNNRAATIEAIMGASGSGKTYRLRGRLKRLPKAMTRRTIVWSPKEPADRYADLYPGSVVVRSVAEVFAIVRKAGASGSFHVVFWPRLNRKVDEAQFDAVCRIALAARNVTFIADELHTVTSGSWAPDGWSQLVMMGRAYGCAVFGLSQRPASMDKDFLGNCSRVSSSRLAYAEDAQAVAKALGCKPAEVLALTGYAVIERDMATGKVTRT